MALDLLFLPEKQYKGLLFLRWNNLCLDYRRSRSRVLEVKQLDTEVKDEVSSSGYLASDILSHFPEVDRGIRKR